MDIFYISIGLLRLQHILNILNAQKTPQLDIIFLRIPHAEACYEKILQFYNHDTADLRILLDLPMMEIQTTIELLVRSQGFFAYRNSNKILKENWKNNEWKLSLNARNVYTYILYTLNLAYDIQSNLWFTDKDTSDYDATLSLPVNETSKLWSLLADTHIYIQFRLLSRVSKFVKLRCKFYFHILQGISQLNESIILKGANFTGFKLWPKSLMKERQWFKTFNTSKMNVRENTPFIINKWSFKCIGIF